MIKTSTVQNTTQLPYSKIHLFTINFHKIFLKCIPKMILNENFIYSHTCTEQPVMGESKPLTFDGRWLINTGQFTSF